ncbi:MAG: sugar nucleotide-binding protein [Candidatus Eisenbacteria bacterium]
MPRLLVTGGTGLAGGALVAAARAAGHFDVHATRHVTPPGADAATAATWHALDVRDATATRALLADVVQPAVVIHAALDVSPGALAAVCVDGSAHVATAARAQGAALVHLSSDMVFAGECDTIYDEDSAPAPVSAYGHAKAEAERRVRAAHPEATIVRLPLLYRLDPPDPAFAAWLVAAHAGRAHPLFVDEIRCPAHVDDVAQALLLVAGALAARRPVPPILHLPGPVPLSRYDFGTGMLAALGLPATLATAGRAADSAVARPRELVFAARRTPPEFTAPLRAPADVFSAAPRPMPPAGR